MDFNKKNLFLFFPKRNIEVEKRGLGKNLTLVIISTLHLKGDLSEIPFKLYLI